MNCVAMFAAYGIAVADIDRRKTYEIPASTVASLSSVQLLAAKACAARLGIHWKVKDG